MAAAESRVGNRFVVNIAAMLAAVQNCFAVGTTCPSAEAVVLESSAAWPAHQSAAAVAAECRRRLVGTGCH